MNHETDTIKLWLESGSINIFGIPFSGKDSQGRRLASKLGGNLLSSGDIFRNSTTQISPKVKAMLDRGELAPTEDFIDIVLPYLRRNEFSASPLILSSVGRWHGEEEGVIGALESSHHPLKAVIYLVLDEELAFIRHDQSQAETSQHEDHRGERTDYGHDALRTRIKEFKIKTMPVIDYYRERGLLIDVNANLPKDDVEKTIIQKLANRASTSP